MTPKHLSVKICTSLLWIREHPSSFTVSISSCENRGSYIKHWPAIWKISINDESVCKHITWIIFKYKKTAQVPIYLLICKEVHCMVASTKYTNEKKNNKNNNNKKGKGLHSFSSRRQICYDTCNLPAGSLSITARRQTGILLWDKMLFFQYHNKQYLPQDPSKWLQGYYFQLL